MPDDALLGGETQPPIEGESKSHEPLRESENPRQFGRGAPNCRSRERVRSARAVMPEMVMSISPDCKDVPIERAPRAAPLLSVPFDFDLAICSASQKLIQAAQAQIPDLGRDASGSIRARSRSRLGPRRSCF